MNKFAAHSLKAAAMVAMAGGAVIGGVAHTSAGAPSTWITNVSLDSYLSAVNADIVDTWVQPNCVEVVGDTCYLGS